MQLVVLGMHRSGTSMLTGLLGLMGCWLGTAAEFMPIRADNPRGDWERLDVWRLDEELLAALGATWCRVAGFALRHLAPTKRLRLEQRAAAIVRLLDAHRPWAIKDPRLCLTFPVWRAALEEPVCVLVHRRPGQVAQSLQARDGFGLAAGVALWECHVLAALRHSAGLPRVLVSHERLVADPVAATAALHGKLVRLGVSGLRVPPAAEIAAWIDPGLYRARADERLERDLLTEPQRALRDALADGSALDLHPPPALSRGARELLESFNLPARGDGLLPEFEAQQMVRITAPLDEAGGQQEHGRIGPGSTA
jgi:hypothetical protein